ncbi:hypothetical protein AB0B85_27965 [Micromonospora sp. NPDC049044]|uniref:hypothetical protein n=1 Tax=Micromonospora sp. NPDC049044 TaxID=3154827 RepID=UPI0033F1847F
MSNPDDAVLDVVFIHGLDGDARLTWSHADRDSFWPFWLAVDFNRVAVWTVDYDAWSSEYRGRSMPIQDRAVEVMAQLQNRGIGDRPLCFVTHSMGGLLVKEILMHSAKGRTEFRDFAPATRGVVFLATPHDGSSIATFVESLGLLYRSTDAVKDLQREVVYLRHLSDDYRDWVDEVRIRNLVFVEAHPTWRVRVVTASSANPGLAGVKPIPIDANHGDICKPLSRDSVVYGQVRRFVGAILGDTARPPPPPPRFYVDALKTVSVFALPAISRLDLISDSIDAAAVPGRISCLVGEGGSGKSVLLAQLAEALVAGESSSGPAVVIVPCNAVSQSADLATEDSVDVAFARAAALPQPERGLRSWIADLRAAYGSVFLLVDTLDVVSTEDTVRAIAAVLGDTADHAQLFLTCREQEFRELFTSANEALRLGSHRGVSLLMPKLDVAEILRWASQFMAELARGEVETERFIESLSDAVRSATVQNVCAVPLRLALACDLYSSTGTVPADLTITGLYESYWDTRVARDRDGRVTSRSRAQQADALELAAMIRAQSSARLALTAAVADAESRTGMRALVSEGVIRRHAGRYEFFHQTYAEFAVARLLAIEADVDQLAELRTALNDPHSHFWPVARHLMLLGSSDDRYRDLRQAVPLRTTEGAQIHLLSALSRRSADLIAEVARSVHDENPYLLHSLAPLLADAHDSCAETALEVVVPLLEDTDRGGVTEAARTVGVLLAKAPGRLRVHRLAWALDLVRKRRAELPVDVWLGLPEHLARPLCLAPDEDALRFLQQHYPDLGVCAQRLILRATLAADEAMSEAFAISMFSQPCPPDMAADEPVELLRRCWESGAVRVRLGWSSWRDVIEADLAERWDAAQVRLVRIFAQDPEIRRDLFATTLSSADVAFRDRWVNAAKFAADDWPEEVLAILCALPVDLGRAGFGSAATLSNHLADGLSSAERQAVIASLARIEGLDRRRIWPALIKLAGAEPGLHEQLLRTFVGVDTVEASAPQNSAPWQIARTSALDTWLNVAPAHFLERQRSWFRAALPATGKRATQRRAKFEGRICRVDEVAREWLSRALLDGPSPAAATAGMNTVGSTIRGAGEALTPELFTWVRHLLASRHTEAARQTATLLADPVITPDSLFADGTLEEVATAAADRLETAIDAREDSQLASRLVELVIRLDNVRPLDVSLIRRVVRKMSEPVLAISARLGDGAVLSVREKAEMASDFSRWAETIGPLGPRRLPSGEAADLVRRVACGWDSHDLGTSISRVMAKVLRNMLSNDPTFGAWLEERLWPAAGAGTKLAIAEAVAVYERVVPGHRALTLARRPDCPPVVAQQIHRWLRE